MACALECSVRRTTLLARVRRQQTHARAGFRELLSLAAPIVAVWAGIMLMGVVDSIMVGRYSAQALASVAIGTFYSRAGPVATSEPIRIQTNAVMELE